MVSPTRDASEWPIVRVYLPAQISREEYSANLAAMTLFFQRGVPFGILVDARNASALTAAQRRELAASVQLWHSRYPDRLVAIAVVCSLLLQRGVVTAVNWLLRPAHALRAFTLPDDAAVWLHECIALAPAASAKR